MRKKIKQNLCILLFLAVALYTGLLWWSQRPVDIVAVHKSGSHSYALVKTFPFFDKQKINWWLKNKAMLKEKYDIPNHAKDDSFTVIFWDFGEGYKETDGYDRLCFDDMKTELNCIDKESMMMVKYSKNTGLYFRMSSGIYYLKDDGTMIKKKYE